MNLYILSYKEWHKPTSLQTSKRKYSSSEEFIEAATDAEAATQAHKRMETMLTEGKNVEFPILSRIIPIRKINGMRTYEGEKLGTYCHKE